MLLSGRAVFYKVVLAAHQVYLHLASVLDLFATSSLVRRNDLEVVVSTLLLSECLLVCVNAVGSRRVSVHLHWLRYKAQIVYGWLFYSRSGSLAENILCNEQRLILRCVGYIGRWTFQVDNAFASLSGALRTWNILLNHIWAGFLRETWFLRVQA